MEVPVREIDHILRNKFSYYLQLDGPDKRKFVLRLIDFMETKHFSTREGLVLTTEMQVLVSASAIQLTFGLDEYTFDKFHEIILYPKAYYNKQTEKWHKGEISLAGAIVLSWTSFQAGYAKASDNLNLGLHEMAHALRFDKFKSDDYDRFFAQYFDRWYSVAKEEFIKLKRHEPSFFREYGGTNINEFFSVCVEYFFESPQAFRERLPEIYKHMCILLNQDPSLKIGPGLVREALLQPAIEKEPEEPVLFSTSTPGFVAPSAIFWIFPIIMLGPAVNSVQAGYYTFPTILALLLVLAVFFHVSMTYKRFYIYRNALVVKFPALRKPQVYPLEHIVRLTLHEETNSVVSNSMELNYIDEERIRSQLFIIYLNDRDIRTMADLLTEKKIPVMIKGFKEIFS